MAEGQPTGPALATGTYDGDTISAADYENVEFDLGGGTPLTSGTKYAIEVSAASGDRDDDQVLWILSTAGYANGSEWDSQNSGSTWTEVPAWDNWFQTKEVGTVKDSFTPGSDAAQDSFAGIEWAAQTFTASSSYTINKVVLRLKRWFAFALPGTITVNVKAVEGAAAPPTKASTPSPTDANTAVTLDQATVTWVDGGGADTFNVYYGTTSGSLSLVSSAQAGTSFTVTGITDGSPYAYLSTRYWRIDSTNGEGTTTGDEWSFTTIQLAPPTQTSFYQGQYYQLLVQADGSYGDPPGVGVENTDYVYLAAGYEANFIATNRKLVAIAENRVWYEDL